MKLSFDIITLDEPVVLAKLPDYCEIAVPRTTEQQIFSITATLDERSLVCSASLVPANAFDIVEPWRAMRIEGQINFAMVGVLSQLTTALAKAGISIFSISTYCTDYILVRSDAYEDAKKALSGAGHRFF